MCFFGFGAGENERETHHGWIAVQWHSNLSPLKGEMSRSDKGGAGRHNDSFTSLQQNPRLEKNRKRTESEKRKMLPQIFALFIESR